MTLRVLVYEKDYGWTFFDFRLFGFRLSWFTDCVEWFVYIGRKHYLRFSGAGFMCDKLPEVEE
jgi:hypothetical protein